MMLRAVLLVACLILAGCLGSTQAPDPGDVVLRGTVLDPQDRPVQGARVQVQHPGGIQTATTDTDGGFSVLVDPGDCTITVTAPGYTDKAMVGSCQQVDPVRIRLAVSPGVDAPPEVEVPEDTPAPVVKHAVRGSVRDQNGTPVRGATVQLGSQKQVTAGQGAFAFKVPDGQHLLRIEAPCSAGLQQSVLVAGAPVDVDAVLKIDTQTPIEAPEIAEFVTGPGPGMTTLRWDPVDDAVGYRVYRDGEPWDVGTNTVFGDHNPGSRDYAVSAIDACGREGPLSTSGSYGPMPGQSPTAGVRDLSSADGSRLRAYPTYDADLNVTGSTTWRIVTGTGNCCENYVTTDASGRIVDFGGTFLHFSDDEGQTWQTVQTPIPYLTGEGAQVTAPNGDIVAVGWSPYSGDQLWAHKYVAADQQWYYQVMPIHQPFYDRAWVSIVQGPIWINGQLAPYIVQVESNYHGSFATVLLRSLDGLTYYEPSEPQLAVGESSSQLPALGWNPDADWVQPISQSPTRPLGPGAGLQLRSGIGAGCHWNLLLDDGGYSCPGKPYSDFARNRPPFVDSAGSIHTFSLDGGIQYQVIHPDATYTASAPFLPGWSVRTHDEKVNAQLDTAVVALHMRHSDGRTGDFLYRFVNITGEPELEAIHQVGGADTGSDSGLGGERRFDFMTVGLLPDGRAVLSFTDDEFHPPALAVEQ